MKALTIWQPWASLIMLGAKPYEFRGRKPPASLIGQRIAIHAGARPVHIGELAFLLNALDVGCGEVALIADKAYPFLDRLWKKGKEHAILSHVLGTAILGEPKPGDVCARELCLTAGNDSERPGTFNWGWPLTDIEPLSPPIPARGAQGFWEWGGA